MKKRKIRPAYLFLILTAVVLAGIVRFAEAKYTKTISFQGKITFSARLADEMVLQEHKAIRQSDGRYVLDDEVVTAANAYTLIPGLNVPKDPHILISGKTDIPAYLYIEIVDTLDTVQIGEENVKLVDYSVSSVWIASNLAPRHGGTVYAYCGNGQQALVLDETNTPQDEIYILHENEIIVSQYSKLKDITVNNDEDVLTIYAYLIETLI